MALLFIDGFDAGDFAQKYFGSANTSSNTTTRFSTGRSMIVNPAGVQQGYLQKFITASSMVYVGAAFYLGNLGTSLLRVWGDSGVTLHLTVYTSGTGVLFVSRNGTTILSSAAGLITTGKWNFIEFSASINDTTGTCELKLNGVSLGTFTGDTKNAGTNLTIDRVDIHNDSGNTSFYVDDLYICDGTGGAPYNTFLGDVRVHTMTPSAAGNTTQFTPSSGANYTAVDELPYSATDYVSAAAPTTKDTYAMSDLPAGTATVYGVQTNIIAKKTDAGNIGVKPIVRSGATDYSGTAVVLTASDAVISDLRVQDPATSAAWTTSGVNNMETGMEIS